MYLAAVPIGFLGYLLFTPPAGASDVFLIGWLGCVTVLLHLSLIIAYRHLIWSDG